MSKSDIIFNFQYRTTSEYYRGNTGSAKSASLKDAFEYYDNPEKCDNTSLDEAFNYYDYRLGSDGGFNKNGHVTHSDINKSCSTYKPEVLYRCVFSFDDEFAMKNNIKNSKGMRNLIKKTMDKNLKTMGFDPDNVEWFAFYHTNTEHPHVHVAFYEKRQSRNRFLIPKKDIEKVRSNIVKQMKLNVEFYSVRDNLKQDIFNEMDKLGYSDDIKKLMIRTENNSHGYFKKDKQLTKKLQNLENKLPRKGSLKYNSANMDPYRPLVDEIIEGIITTDPIMSLYGKYAEHLDKEVVLQKQLYGGEENDYNRLDDYKDSRLKVINNKIGNMILSNLKDYRNDKDEWKQEEGGNGKSRGRPKTKRKFLNQNMRRRVSMLKFGSSNELDRAISEAYYASMTTQRKIEEATKRAREDSYTMH